MKKIDFDNLSEQLEDLEKEVERLKTENPDDDFSELDKSIEDFRMMISENNIKKFKAQYYRRKFIYIVLAYLYHIIVILSIFGFFIRFINQEVVNYFVFIIPIMALVIFVFRKISRILICCKPFSKHQLIYSLSLYFIFSAMIGIFDFYFLNIWTSIWNSILTLGIIGFTLNLGEFVYYRKLIGKYRKEK